MANTYTLISSNVLSSSAASVTFSAIPATYTDLVLRVSMRSDRASANDVAMISFNSASINISCTYLYSTYSTSIGQSGRDSASTSSGFGWMNGATSTSNTFASGEIYIPNYASTTLKKPFGNTLMMEDNATGAYGWSQASLADSTSAITSIVIARLFGTNLVSGSSFYLYGISNA
jgi:hypothetical protein